MHHLVVVEKESMVGMLSVFDFVKIVATDSQVRAFFCANQNTPRARFKGRTGFYAITPGNLYGQYLRSPGVTTAVQVDEHPGFPNVAERMCCHLETSGRGRQIARE
jgi:hypothetical protein